MRILFISRPRSKRRSALGLGRVCGVRVIDDINDQLHHPLTLRDLAATVSLSPSHCTRLFTRALGRAPHQYLIQQRIERATTVLVAGNATIATVAHRVGFADHRHLNRHFKRAFGGAPAAVLRSTNVHLRA
jgi:AraC family transcriptional regulator